MHEFQPWAVGLAACLAPMAACTVSPQPVPEPAQLVQLDHTGIHLSAEPGGRVLIAGGARTVDTTAPDQATVRVIDLDGSGSLAVAVVRADGGFSVALSGELDDAFRIDVVARGGRSEARDFIGDGRGSLSLREDCFSLRETSVSLGYAKVDAPVQETAHVTNHCAESLTLRDVIAVGDPGVDPLTVARPTLASGESTSLAFEVKPTKAGNFFSGVIVRDASGLHRAVIALEAQIAAR